MCNNNNNNKTLEVWLDFRTQSRAWFAGSQFCLILLDLGLKRFLYINRELGLKATAEWLWRGDKSQTLTEKELPQEQPCSACGFRSTRKEERMSSWLKSSVAPFTNSRLSLSTITPTPFCSKILQRCGDTDTEAIIILHLVKTKSIKAWPLWCLAFLPPHCSVKYSQQCWTNVLNSTRKQCTLDRIWSVFLND